MNLEQEEVVTNIISEFGAYVEKNPMPPIADADLLPYPKDVIYAALEWKERYLCDTANALVRGQQEVPKELEKLLII